MLNLKNAVSGSGFSMNGYYVWCGSVIKENGIYYMFASRWKRELGFPKGYMLGSEIVLATTKDLSLPFEFQKVVIGKRESTMWDGTMAHNPCIVKADGRYILYYIGSCDGSKEKRAIGYATAGSLTGDWERASSPIALPQDANNPCVISDGRGGVLLYYRDGDLKVSVAYSDEYFARFKTVVHNIFPKGKIEDMFVYKEDGMYKMICEDADGVYTGVKKGGVIFNSYDGVVWDEEGAESAYGFNIEFDNGKKLLLQRRERPMLLNDGNKRYLFTAAKFGGESILEGGYTFNLVQEIGFR
ncbi:MAG: hypothetical protein E7612_09485 [Ruminococcaceae bacterium]|nr:hypothetical protein [Oscillospiraceae bacterium]